MSPEFTRKVLAWQFRAPDLPDMVTVYSPGDTTKETGVFWSIIFPLIGYVGTAWVGIDL